MSIAWIVFYVRLLIVDQNLINYLHMQIILKTVWNRLLPTLCTNVCDEKIKHLFVEFFFFCMMNSVRAFIKSSPLRNQAIRSISRTVPAFANPQVFFDFKIADKDAGRVVFELYADVVPKTAGSLFIKYLKLYNVAIMNDRLRFREF